MGYANNAILWAKTQIVRLSLYYLGMAIETAYKVEPQARKDMDSLPESFTFCMGVEKGPSLFIRKDAGTVKYVGEKDAFDADLELRFKNIEYAFLAMTGRIGTPDAVYHNRQYVKGSLNRMMVMIRVMNIAQTLLFPNFLVGFYIKEVPRLTVNKMINRVKAYSYSTAGYFF